MKRHFYSFCLLLMVLATGACKKEKQDVFFDRKDILNSPASSIRIYNFTNGLLNVSVNNIQLTSFVALEDIGKSAATGTELGLSFFPSGVWSSKGDGSPLTIPSTLLDKYGKARIYIVPGYDTKNTSPIIPGLKIDTVLQHDPLHPVDYFLLSDGHFRAIPRSIEVPVAPDHFKVRILNFGAAGDTLGLGGPVSLTYADGTLVDPVLDGVATGAVSGYVEVPYGTYQFKLFVNNDHKKQLAEAPIFPYFYVCSGITPPQAKIFPVMKTFKPGGTYSIFITNNTFMYYDCVPESKVYANINAYRIITENSPPLNISYARVMGINALTDQGIRWKMDGKEMGQALASGKATDPSIVIVGTHTFSAYDGSGKLLVEKSYPFSAADYVSAWVYSKNGSPDILFTSNNMTNSHYIVNPPGDDGTNGAVNITSFDYAWQSRFLNLSDIPYATFTNQDGQNFEQAMGYNGTDILNPRESYQNLTPGEVVEHEPSVIIPCTNNDNTAGRRDAASFSGMPSLIRVFQSTPGALGQTPGNWLSSVTPLTSQDFIARTDLYETGLPVTETGVYSVALIGKLEGSGGQKARLIFVKHNK